jgi:hypothetical protein
MIYPFIENDTYRTNFSIISHYGNNRTDIVDLYNETNYSNDYCQYCHNNENPFIEWNKLKQINHYGSQTCDECHGSGRLHNETLTQVLTDANCTNCHATYGSSQPGLKYKINVTAVNLGVHANVNSNMTPIAAAPPINDANNAKCWGCHVPGGTYPEEGHKGTFNNDAYLCYECHNGTYAYENVSNATAVYNHFKSDDNISACTTADTISESCASCHNLTSMKVPGFDEFDGAGQAEYRLSMSQASHYTRNRTDDIELYDDLSDCAWCHRNSTNEFIDIFERAGSPNYTENIPHAIKTSGCIVPECHGRGRIHDSSLTIPTLNWSEQCASCHFGLSDSDAYVNETMFNASVHGDVNCTMCHINTQTNHPVDDYTWK